ncbi:hypothetical protein AB0346_16250 [Nocardia beijingensis]|uniref:hypothetical protein n=1 Tax=Nocardia beijingensis TaxID=95162 RepID=UPI00344DD22E
MNEFVRSFRKQHIHVRVIIAGSDITSAADNTAIDYAVYRLRDIFVNAGIGIGLILRQGLTLANSKGHAAIVTEDGIRRAGADLTNDFPFITQSGHTADGSRTALPVVVPANMLVPKANPDGTITFVGGKSPEPGPCAYPGVGKSRSAVIGISGESTGRTMAHEVGHFLGASHPANPDNSLMTQSVNVMIDAFDAVTINAADVQVMLRHCKILPGLVGVV